VSAVFDDRRQAERAVGELQSAGVSGDAVSFIARDEGGEARAADGDGADEGGGEKAAGVASKAALGSGVGAALGVAALAVPGVGPLVAAGAVAEAAAGGAALAGAAVGGAAGGLSGLLAEHGVSDEDSRDFEERINNGGAFVSVDADRARVAPDVASEILHRAGGRSSSRARLS
jgi:hypothetical protein